ncbi:MAG: hemolysin III family protein [Gemmataceae bacterium]
MDFHDPLAAWSHLLMAGWCFFAGTILIRCAHWHSVPKRIALGAYLATMVLLYGASGFFHAIAHLPTDRSFRNWQLLDQSAIFGLIYGSNIPMFVYVLPKRIRNRMILGMGLPALVGIISLWAFPKPPYTPLVIAYLSMGLLSLLPVRSYYRVLGWWGIRRIAFLTSLFFLGGLCEALDWPNPVPGWLSAHEMLHIFIMAGTAAHYSFVLRIVLQQNFGRSVIDNTLSAPHTETRSIASSIPPTSHR